jgi:hypothetical protein
MNRMRKCNDEVYQLAKDQAVVKKLKKNKRFRPFCLCLPGLDCHVCGSQYVGEMNGHRSDLTKKTLLPVSQHFVSPNGWFREQLGERFTFFNFFTMMTDNACNFL